VTRIGPATALDSSSAPGRKGFCCSLAKLLCGRSPSRFRARRSWPELGPPARGRLCRTEPDGGALATFAHDEITGLGIDCLFRPQNGLNCPPFSRNPDEAGRLCGYSLRLVRKSGETIAVNVSITPVKWGDADYLFVTARTTNATLSCVSSATENSGAWSEHEDFPSMIGQSEKIHGVCRLIGSVAKSEVTVLIQGESGTGKEIVANAIHAHSHRCRGSFVKMNCAALTDTLLESELFGHVRGAFTGAIRDRRGRFKQAEGGTILLDARFSHDCKSTSQSRTVLS
jgi:sigma-54 interacting transcriptional regulator